MVSVIAPVFNNEATLGDQLKWCEIANSIRNLALSVACRSATALADWGTMPASDGTITPPDGRPILQAPNPPVPFIVGRGRSGTTLLQAMFDSHPDVAMPHESHLIVPVCRNRHRFESSAGLNIARFAEAARMTWIQRWGCPEAELRRVLEAARPSTVEDGLRAMFSAYAAGRGKSR